MSYTCIGTLAWVDAKARTIDVVLCDGDQYTDNVTIKVPKKFPLPTVVDDIEFLGKYGRLPKTIEKCHIKIGYDYAYDVKKYEGKFKFRKPVYLGEVRARSCSSMNHLKRNPGETKPKGHTFDIRCKECKVRIKGEHCVFLPTLSTYVVCKCGYENIVPFTGKLISQC
jgi:hypothetical protein